MSDPEEQREAREDELEQRDRENEKGSTFFDGSVDRSESVGDLYRCTECGRVVGDHLSAGIHSSLAAEVKASELREHPSAAYLPADTIVEGHHVEKLDPAESAELREQWEREGRRCRRCGSNEHCTECCAYGECKEAEAVIAKLFVELGGTVGRPAPPPFEPPEEIGRRAMAILAQGRESARVREAVEWFAREFPPKLVTVRTDDEVRRALREHGR